MKKEMNEEIIDMTDVDYSKIDYLINEIIEQVASYMENVPHELIRENIMKAYIFAKEAHHGQFRKSGDPYLIHPVEATRELLILHPDLVTIQACLLHDVPEDTPRTVEEIQKIFGEGVAHITGGMEKLSKLKYRGEERMVGSLRKMFIAISEDVRVVFVKLADRIHNMRTIQFHPDPEKRKRIAIETLNIYAPIADRLGIFDFKETLETLCFLNLYPEEYKIIREELDHLKIEQKVFVEKVRDIIYETIPAHVPLIDVSYRIKSPFSIYKKMQRKGYENVHDLYDLFALRIITDNIPHCYEILGEVHNRWSPIPKRFKDYIALPKENGYQSLHTTVIGVLKELGSTRANPTEIQIRTKDMHLQAEIGVAAHFEYSETGQSTIAKDVYWVSEIKKIVDQSKEQEDSEFMSSMKLGLFDDRIFVFSPKGDVINLSKGSTPVDFAYSIHSDLGNHLAIAKVNGRIVPLDYELANGDRVEIIIDKNKKPLISWLSFVKTSRAREVIKSYMNKSNREELIEKGKFIMNSYLNKNYGITLDKELSILKNIDGRVLDTKEKEDLLVQIGNLSRKPMSVVRGIMESGNFTLKRIVAVEEKGEKDKKIRLSSPEEIMIGGEKNIPYKIALCCIPKPGDKIIGYITRTGVNIHKIDCGSLRRGNLERFIDACFGDSKDQKPNGVILKIEMIFENKIGVLRKLTDILFKMNINIEEIISVKIGEDRVNNIMTLESRFEDYYIFERLIERIKLTIPEFIEGKLVEIK